MTGWKKKIDPELSVLLKKAAKCQVEFGMSDMIIDCHNIAKKRRELVFKGSVKRKVMATATVTATYSSLEEHNRAICDCQKCSLGQTRTKFVYGVGSPKAGVMFIGEAPGRTEDLQGEPFVGRAGQLLDKILAAIKFTRENIYIANILKCRPPDNRDPLPDEMEICMPYLKEQIRLIKPDIICALGRISAQALLQTSTPIGKLRKQWHSFEGIPFLITYHPAALLRFPAYKKDTWEDVQMLRAKYDELMNKK
jgi:uracil-DNA glycosylase